MNHLVLKNKKGTAAFMALLVVTIVTSLALIIFLQMRVSIKQTNQILTSQQAYLFSQGVLDWAASALKNVDKLPMELPQTPTLTGSGWVAGQLDEYKEEVPEVVAPSPPSNQPSEGAAQSQQVLSDAAASPQSKQAMAAPAKKYLLRSEVQYNNQHLIFYSVLQSTIMGEKSKIVVISQARGET